jgi:16S rRNA (uracil1498-N3)-methyltransferase
VTEGFCATAPAVAHVFVDDVDHDDDRWIEGDDGHHLQRVRRLRAGEAVTVSDGRGAWRLTEIAEVGERRLRVTTAGPLVHEPALTPRVVVAFAPAKGDHGSAVVHQLVELGVDAVMPISLRRSVARVDGRYAERARGRLTRVAREAAMQSRRARLPEVRDPEPLAALASHPGLIVATAGGRPAANVAEATPGPEWLIVVGPEGGFDAEERDELAKGSPLGVGPHVLRSVTAPVAALAALVGFRK